MGKINCCRPETTSDEPKNEIETHKFNMKIITDIENIEEINKFSINNFHNHDKAANNDKSNQENAQVVEIKPNSPNLLIDIINSTAEPKGIRLNITPLGLQNSQRNSRDGITYFGYQSQTAGEIDYLIKPKDDKFDERFIGLHFYIRFVPLTQQYVIRDLCNGFGTFIKITNDILIKDNDLLNIGENYLVFTLGVDDDALMSESYTNRNEEEYNKPILSIKIFSSSLNNHGALLFSPEKKRITVGRSAECDVIIEDNMLSRIHCTIIYKIDAWYIIDGSIASIDEIKRSTNGTWIYPLEEMEIKDKMTFKSNHNLFNCSYIYKSSHGI